MSVVEPEARMPLPDSRLNAIGSVAGSKGKDPALDGSSGH